MTEFCGGLQDGAGAYLSGGAVNEQEHVLLSNGIKNETEADGGGNIVTANDESGYSGVVGSVDAYAALRKVPFCRSVDLSSYWKKHANAMEAAIWTTVSSCQYDDLNKKERLYLAVSDALSGKRTIKAASAQHSIPFTTVQTYFHRARQAATNALLELDKRRDMELPKQIEIPVLLTTSKYNDDEGHGSSGEVVWNTDHKDDVKPNSSGSSSNIKRSGGKLNEVLLNLTAKMQQQRDAEHNSVCSSSTEKNASRFAVGSSSMKRKPKSIRRLVSAELMNDGEGTANEQISFMDGFDEATEDSDNSDIHYEDIDCSEESDESEENFDESVTNWHRSVAERSVEGSDVSAATKKRLVRAILYVWTGQMRAEEACVHYCLDEEYFEKYFEHYDELLRTLTRPLCSDLLLSMNAIAKNDGDVNGIESDIGAINMQIEEVYRKSHYSAEQKVRLHEAILMVLRGERTVNGAANMMQLPASTLHPYVQKARLAIGDCSALLSKTMSSLNDSSGDSNRKAIQPEWSDIAQVNDCVKGFLDEIPFDENIKAKLQAAILMCVLYGKAVKDSSDANDVPLYILKRCIREVQRKCALLNDSKAIAAGKTQPGFGITDDKASDEEVRCIVLKLLANSSTRNRRRDQLISAVTKAVSGRFTIKDASQMEGLPVSTVHPYVSKARHMLGNRCPAPKGTATEVEQAVNLARLQWCSEVDKFGAESAGVSNVEEGDGKEAKKLLRKRHLSSPSRSTSSSSSSCEGNSLQTYEDELMLYRNMNAMNLHENIAKNVKEVRIKYLIYLLVLRQYRRSFREQVLLSKALAHVLLDGLLVEEVAETNLGLSMYILKAYVKRCREVNHCIMQEFPVFRSGVRDLRIERQKNANLFHVPPEFDELAAASSSERCIAKVKYDRAKREWLGTVLNGRVAEPMASYLQKLWAVNFPVGADLVQGLAQYTFRSVYPEVVMESDVWLGWVRDYCDEHGYLADSDI